jgi:hypothetical protein
MAEHGFKSKSIRKILKNKISHWIASIDDDSLKSLLRRDVLVTGGSITSMLMGDEIKDFDIYFKTQETTKAVAEYYCKKFIDLNKDYYAIPKVEVGDDGRVEIKVQSQGIVEEEGAQDTPEGLYESELGEGGSDAIADYILKPQASDEVKEKERYRPVFLSANAITLSDKIQLVIRFYGNADEIHKNYDFEHCKNVYNYATDELILKASAMESILSKTLLYTGSLYPICSLFRMRKFIDRGWRISAGEILKMAWQVNELNLNSVSVIREQLTGCDQAYMNHLIVTMNQGLKENPDRKIDSLYIVELVDKVFNQ